MILIPSFTKKHAAALVLGVAAVTTMVFAVGNRNGAGPESAPATAPVVTLDGYQTRANEAARGLVGGDADSVTGVIDRLLALSVPEVGMAAHLELVSILTAYRQALAAADTDGVVRTWDRLKIFVQENPWIGIVIND